MRNRLVGAVFVGALAVGCSSSSSSGPSFTFLDAQTFCNQYVNTCKGGNGETVDQCLQTARALRVSQACADAMKNASCNDLTSSTAPLNDTCFPKCNKASTATCESDQQALDSCNADGRTQVFDCKQSCAATSTTSGMPFYSGTCGTSYQGKTSTQPQCWCTK
jgi:hypothetical protein